MFEPTSTDVHFERALLERLHATDEWPREPIVGVTIQATAELALADALRDLDKWRAVASVTRRW